MKRSEFLRACLVGVSSCAACGVAALEASGGDAAADSSTLDSVRVRYAALVDLISKHVPEEAQRKIFRDLGRECARQTKGMTWEKHGNDVKALLAQGTAPDGWMVSADFDEKAGTLTVVDRSCTCPLVKKALTPGLHCECTLGWQEETYSRMLGKPVEATLGETVLRGGTKCVFYIRVKR
jgi:predicted hydrocarbon binding protein